MKTGKDLYIEKDFSKCRLEELPNGPVLDRQLHFHHPHTELGEIHLTGLKENALNARDNNCAMAEGTFPLLNLS